MQTVQRSLSPVYSNLLSSLYFPTFKRFHCTRKMSTVAKSYEDGGADPIISYCTKLTVTFDPLEQKLADETIKNHKMYGMLGAPEVLQLGKNFIQLIGAKRVLDIGTFTGGSALSWALALPADGEVISMDVSHDALNSIGKPIITSNPEVSKKIKFELAPAIETLDNLIKNGQVGKFDFAFIDADKENYSNYYKQCMQLLRPGGVIFVDNSLWNGAVVREPKTEATKAIDACNKLIFEDNASNSALLNVGDGLHMAFKK